MNVCLDLQVCPAVRTRLWRFLCFARLYYYLFFSFLFLRMELEKRKQRTKKQHFKAVQMLSQQRPFFWFQYVTLLPSVRSLCGRSICEKKKVEAGRESMSGMCSPSSLGFQLERDCVVLSAYSSFNPPCQHPPLSVASQTFLLQNSAGRASAIVEKGNPSLWWEGWMRCRYSDKRPQMTLFACFYCFSQQHCSGAAILCIFLRG